MYCAWRRYSVKLSEDNVIEKIQKLCESPALGQTQSNLQWKYYAKTITEFCEIFDLNKDNFTDSNNLFVGYNLLAYLYEVLEELEGE